MSILDGKYHKWYYCNQGSRRYLPKNQKDFAIKLAKKKFLQAQLKDLTQKNKAVNAFLSQYPSENKAFLLATAPEYQELLAASFVPISKELLAWQNAPFPSNPQNPEQLCIKACSGNLVRSKSEAIIDMVLSHKSIPFRYECALQLGSTTLYPDFTIRHPRTGEVFYYEHFGLMDDPNYRQKAIRKLDLYTKNGIIPSINLITTYETKTNPLSPEIVEKNIAFYFNN